MSGPASVAKVLVLSEDSSEHGTATIQSLLQHMLGQIDAKADLRRIELRPTDDLPAVHGNVWKSAKKTANAAVVDLVQRIARHLVMDDGFVVHHVDGDRIWSEQSSSENVLAYRNIIVRRVREQVRVWTEKKRRGTDVDARMTKLVMLMPFWCIEAWLFQNTQEARSRLRCGEDLHECSLRLEAWEQDRTLLDEYRTPKDLLCIKDAHNITLAGSLFPKDDVLAAGKSYAAAIETLMRCTPLIQALGRTALKPG